MLACLPDANLSCLENTGPLSEVDSSDKVTHVPDNNSVILHKSIKVSIPGAKENAKVHIPSTNCSLVLPKRT